MYEKDQNHSFIPALVCFPGWNSKRNDLEKVIRTSIQAFDLTLININIFYIFYAIVM